jgi:hypothetical protein
LTIEPNAKSQNAGLSITFTGTPSLARQRGECGSFRVVLERADRHCGAVKIGRRDCAHDGS